MSKEKSQRTKRFPLQRLEGGGVGYPPINDVRDHLRFLADSLEETSDYYRGRKPKGRPMVVAQPSGATKRYDGDIATAAEAAAQSCDRALAAIDSGDALATAEAMYELLDRIVAKELAHQMKAITAGMATIAGGLKAAQQTNASYSRPSKEQLIAEMDRIKAQTGAGRTEVIKRAAKKLGIGKSTAYKILKE